jgi:hypothetical protein
VTNLYILDQGLKNWRPFFAAPGEDGHALDPSRPSPQVLERQPKDAYQPKIKLKTNKRAGGVCS